MKRLFLIAGTCLLPVLQSCTSDSGNGLFVQPEEASTISRMVVMYDGQVYDTDVIQIGDSVKYLNAEYAKLFNSIKDQISNFTTMVCSDGMGTTYVEYLHSEKELLDKYDIIDIENTPNTEPLGPTRGGVIDMMTSNNTSPIIAVAELYDDKNFSDTKLISYATTTWATSIPRLKELGFNDKTSSIKVFNKMNKGTSYTMGYYDQNTSFSAMERQTHLGSGLRPVLICYHNSNFSGGMIYCISSPTGSSVDHLDTNLKTIGWNDKISGIAWAIVYDFRAFEKKSETEGPEIQAHPDC